MEVINDYWNLLEQPVMDKSTKTFEYNEFKEDNISDISTYSNYEITIRNNKWKLLSEGYLCVRSKIELVADEIVAVSNNGLNDFLRAQLFYENKEIERIDYLGVTSTISNLVEFTGDVSDTVASQLCWYPDTSDKAERFMLVFNQDDKELKIKDTEITFERFYHKYLKQNQNFNRGFLQRYTLSRDRQIIEKWIPLKRVFRFCRDVNKVLNGEIKIKLRKNEEKDILHAVKDVVARYKITYLSIWIPEVEPSLQVQAELEKLLSFNQTISYGFNYANCYRSNLQSTIDGTWRVTASHNKVTGVYVVFSKVGRKENIKESMMIFDHMNLERIYINVNNMQYPTRPYECNFTAANLDYMRLYTAFLGAGLKNDIDEGTCVSYKDFGSVYTIIYFNLTKKEDEIQLATTELEINWKLRTQPKENYYLYAVIETENILHISILEKKIFIE